MKKWLISAIILFLFFSPAFAASGGKRTGGKNKKQLSRQTQQMPRQQKAAEQVNRDNCAYLFMELEDGSIIVVRICW